MVWLWILVCFIDQSLLFANTTLAIASSVICQNTGTEPQNPQTLKMQKLTDLLPSPDLVQRLTIDKLRGFRYAMLSNKKKRTKLEHNRMFESTLRYYYYVCVKKERQ